MLCRKCGAQNPECAVFCKVCGMRLSESPKVPASTVTRTQGNTQRPSGKKRRPVHTTRKTSMLYLLGQAIGDGCVVVMSILLLARAGELIDSYWYRSDGEKLQTFGFAFLLLGIFAMFYHAMVSRTYADVFEDRISGSAMQGVQMKTFHLRFDQITGVSVSRGFLNLEAGGGAFLIISTTAGEYKIITTSGRATEIAEYCSRAMRQAGYRYEN